MECSLASFRVSVVVAVALVSLTGCPQPNSPDDGSGGGDASSDAAGDGGNGGNPCAAGCPMVRQLGAGDRFTCAVITDGTVRCWGEAANGQLADGTTMQERTHPVMAMGLQNIVEVAGGYEHACARAMDGSVSCWGLGGSGQLGNGMMNDSSTPVAVTGLTNAVKLAGGYLHTCAVLADGRAMCWGRGSELGTGMLSSQSTPVAVMGVTSAVDIAASASSDLGSGPFTCAVLRDGSVTCWGDNGVGQLGNGNRDPQDLPVSVMGITNARHIAVGGAHACALLADGSVSCWGSGVSGEVGPNGQDVNTTPVTVPGITGATAIVAGDQFTCVILGDQSVSCWGLASYGELGRGMLPAVGAENQPVPAPIVNCSGATALAAGIEHACAYCGDGTTRCWGSNLIGQLGNGTDSALYTDQNAVPTAILW